MSIAYPRSPIGTYGRSAGPTYCKSGRMSAEAAATLQELGYTDIVELSGGMDAWIADGRQLLPPAG